MSEGALNVNNTAYDKDVQVGGGVAFELAKGSAAAGAAISINDVDNSILARMEGNTIGSGSALAGSVNNLAVSNLVQVGTATSVGVLMNDGYLMGDVAIAVNMVDNQVQAQSSFAPWSITALYSCPVPGRKPGTSTRLTMGILKQSQKRTKRAALREALQSSTPA